MLYLIGLGMNEKGISLEGFEAVKKSDIVYLENYTVDFPYSVGKLEKVLGKKIISLNRTDVESLDFLKKSKNKNLCLLIYGSPLSATTHETILLECRKNKIKAKIIHASSVFTEILNSGLHSYKFGKTASIPKWDKEKKFMPDSFMEIVKENLSINAHTLLLVDIGLELKDALEELKTASEKHKIKLNKVVVCSSLGTEKEKIFYRTLENLEKNKNEIKKPYCIIIPSKNLHFVEEEFLSELD